MSDLRSKFDTHGKERCPLIVAARPGKGLSA